MREQQSRVVTRERCGEEGVGGPFGGGAEQLEAAAVDCAGGVAARVLLGRRPDRHGRAWGGLRAGFLDVEIAQRFGFFVAKAVGFFDDAVGIEAATSRGGQATFFQRIQIVQASVAAAGLWVHVIVPTVALWKLPPTSLCIGHAVVFLLRLEDPRDRHARTQAMFNRIHTSSKSVTSTRRQRSPRIVCPEQ